MQQNIWIQNFVEGAVLVLRHHAKASKAGRPGLGLFIALSV
jgi:hypothetical protein